MEEFKPTDPTPTRLIHHEEQARIQSTLVADQYKLSADSVRALLRLYDGVISARAEVNRLRYYEDQYKAWQREMDRYEIPYESDGGTKLSALGRLGQFLTYLKKRVPTLKHGTPIVLDEGGGMQALADENKRLKRFEQIVLAAHARLDAYGVPRDKCNQDDLLFRLYNAVK